MSYFKMDGKECIEYANEHADNIDINACQSITMESSVTLQKGVLLQTNN